MKLLAPCLRRLPLPDSTPPKLLLPPVPVVSVKVDRPTAPVPASVPMLWSPAIASVAPLLTVTAGSEIKRSALASVSVPPLTATVDAADVPARVLAPMDDSAPAPRLALALAVPPFKA